MRMKLHCATKSIGSNNVWSVALNGCLPESKRVLLYGNLGNLSTGTDDIDARSLCGVRGGTGAFGGEEFELRVTGDIDDAVHDAYVQFVA